ncbi:hypothetical protein [Latilactobacillus curvatus]|uniref:hypothetical protein n=1 Tax=Latilactobacillus curvatus TaxID=28038 RepID=UPI0013A6256E|nr:hypothetical protein [Latilactobacillus curvatus]
MIVLQTLYDMLAVQFHKMSQPKMLLQTEQLMINQLGLQVATLTAEVNQLKGGVPNV